ncbi:MAG: hypothetical protein RMJ86_07360 [Anaerolineae bacterium]|nr:hypothetical protein [Thermoflexales bacterium]MDW8054345.1 hypothetical protein [Anaerolineae bacterium]
MMNRRDFLKRFGLSLSATALAGALGLGGVHVAQAAVPRASALLHHGALGFGGFARGWAKGVGMPMLSTIASALNMSVAELQAELQAGKSVADVAAARGVALEKVVNALVDEYKKQLDAAVAAGRLTQAQADALLANFRAVLPGHLQVRAVPGLRLKNFAFRSPKGGISLTTVASAIGISEAELIAELRAGKSIADVAAAKGVALDKVSNALADAYKQALDASVAAGRLTQAQADAALEQFKANLPHLLALKGGPGFAFGLKRGKGERGHGWFSAPPPQPSATPTQTTGLRF